jgi:hypothetical protein
MPPGAVAGDASSGQHVLDALPENLIDERFMVAVVQHAVEDDLALVIGMGQHAVELAAADRLAHQLAGGAGLEAALLQRIPERRDRPLAGGVLLEDPLDVGCPVRVEDDGLDLDAVHTFGVVEVAERCVVRGTATPDLFRPCPS